MPEIDAGAHARLFVGVSRDAVGVAGAVALDGADGIAGGELVEEGQARVAVLRRVVGPRALHAEGREPLVPALARAVAPVAVDLDGVVGAVLADVARTGAGGRSSDKADRADGAVTG